MKKIKKKPVNPKQVVKESKNSIVLIVIGVIIAVILCGGLLFDHLHKTPIITINGKVYDMHDLGYYFYAVESQYDYYNQMMGGNYWDTVADKEKGTTVRDQAEAEALESSVYSEVLNKEAKAKGYSLTDKEKKEIAESVNNLLTKRMSKEVQQKNGFTKSYLTKILGKEALGARLRKNIIKSLNLDKNKITSSVSKEDNRQYDIEYFFISTKKTDKNNKQTDMTVFEKQAAFDKIKAISEKAKTATDWSKILDKNEKELIYQKGHFTAKDTTSSFSEDLRNKMKELSNNQISEIYEEQDGYYLVRMINNNSMESYKNAVKQAISDAETSGFQKEYQKILKKYKYNINDKELAKYTMGKITLATPTTK